MALEKLNHTQIPNQYLDGYMRVTSCTANKIFLVICRNTIGWHKESDSISVSQIIKKTGIKSETTVRKGLKELIDLDLIVSTKEFYVNSEGEKIEEMWLNKYSINFK